MKELGRLQQHSVWPVVQGKTIIIHQSPKQSLQKKTIQKTNKSLNKNT